MTCLLLWCILALLVPGGFTDPEEKFSPKFVKADYAQREVDLFELYLHPHEPNHVEPNKVITNTWSLEKNIEHFANVNAVTTFVEMLKHNWILPKAVPFNIHESSHKFQAITLFNVLFSAKDYDTFYKTAVYFRERINEYLFSYVLTVVIYHRKDTQSIFVPHIYEVFPTFFYNGEIMTTAQRINTHGFQNIEYYPSTYKWNDNVVIKWNTTIWPYAYGSETPMAYFTHDYGLNAFYYNLHVAEPSWLGGDVVHLSKDRHGEWFWFIHKQIMTRYYMERLSNNLGEVPDLGQEVVKHGYTSGLLYQNGVPFPVRPNNFHLNQPELVAEIQKIYDYERRIRDAIGKGYVVDRVGEHINISVSEAIDVVGRIIEADVDSPNAVYYKDFISLWKKVLGNPNHQEHHHYHHFLPLVVPSVLEHYQTALRDPAFYMIWKRVLDLFQLWHEHLPRYKREELSLPQVAIKNVEIDKLVTYFEHTYVNVSNHLHSSQEKDQRVSDKVKVLVQQPRLNHKVFQVRVHVKSEVAKKVIVRFFLAPKYDSHGHEIPLHINSRNFFLLDKFIHDLPAGDHVIIRDSSEDPFRNMDFTTSYNIYENAQKVLKDGEHFVFSDHFEELIKLPQRLLLPKGRVGGMPFVLMVYISEYHPPAKPYGTGFDHSVTFGASISARYITDQPLGFPVNRPLYDWQVKGLHNLVFQDVMIHHKHTPEIVIPHVW